MNNYIDTHIHFDLFENPIKIMDFYESNKIYAVFVTNLPEYFVKYSEFVLKYKYIKLGVGFHPGLTKTDKFNVAIFDKAIEKTKYIGEIGLDFAEKDKKLRDKQTTIFDLICKKSAGKILSIHTRKAETEIYNILKDNKVMYPILHWYSGSINTMEKLLELGCYFSVNRNMIKSQNGINILKNIPINRVLFETDAPFTTKTIDLKYIENSYLEIERVLNVKELKENIYENFKEILKKNKVRE